MRQLLEKLLAAGTEEEVQKIWTLRVWRPMKRSGAPTAKTKPFTALWRTKYVIFRGMRTLFEG